MMPVKNCPRSILLRLSGISAGVAIFFAATSLEAAPDQNKLRPFGKKGQAAELPVIKSITGTRMVVGEKEFEVNELTIVVVNGEKATLGDLKVGMQASVSGGVKDYGNNRGETVYKATRIMAREDNLLAEKAAEFNKNASKLANQNGGKNKKPR